MQERLISVELDDWQANGVDSAALAAALEDGKVLYFPKLAFAMSEAEQRFLSPAWSDGKAKNIGYDGAIDKLKGAQGDAADLAALKAMVKRYRESSINLITSLFPHYRQHLRIAQTSFRPSRVEGRVSSWRKDDSRLHVDAFPSRPNHGERILRVFNNVNPQGEPRQWRVGQRFDDVAARYLGQIGRPLPGSAALMNALHITKSRRSEYDHIMLQLHDRMKADPDYQANSPQLAFGFPPGSTWVCFSDQTPHAAMGGQFMFEQTLHLPVNGLHHPECSPLRVLERMRGYRLVA
ncbi:Kdo hydroxylase family protein [Chitinimonas sp.]|uniref:Kdo hydroxylase family protein n=1 Tax=Chitinimonas sp. TaxID=1934313 RepID=UPI0035B328DE